MENAGSIQNITRADLAVCEKADSFLQSSLWGNFKSRFGWEPRAFLIDWAGAEERPLLVLSRRLAPGISFAYAPWGPEPPVNFPGGAEGRTRILADLARNLKPLLPRNTAFIRFDPPWFAEETAGEGRKGAAPPGPPLKRAAADIQPPDTVLVDLTLSREEILAAMHKKWRYNIGLAAKRGVRVSKAGEKDIDVFYRLLTETAERDGIAIHSMRYYQTLFELCRQDTASALHLYIARHEGDALAAIVVLCRREQAVYLYGASSGLKRNLMAPYALQWRAMTDAKDSGPVVYDLFGIPPGDDPKHPMAGLYRFKTGFGGRIIHRCGSWDYAYKPGLRSLFNAAEKFRKRLRDAKKKTGGL